MVQPAHREAEYPPVRTADASLRLAFRFADDQPWLVLAAGTQAEIALDARYCAIPNAPAWFYGVVNLRGAIYPVFDVAAWCGIQTGSASRRILLVDQGEFRAGLLCAGEPAAIAVSPVVGSSISPARLRDFISDTLDSARGPAVAFDHRHFFAAAGRERALAAAT